MEKITGERCLKLMKEYFPVFSSYWDSYIENYDSDLGIAAQMLPFEKFAVEAIKAKDEIKIKKIFYFVEFLFLNGDESVRNATAKSFLENLMGRDPEQIKFSTFVQHLGKYALRYCRAYDKFTNSKTEGLWDNHSVDVSIDSSPMSAAIRYELVTGEQVLGRPNSQEGRDMITCLERWLQNNPTANLGDRAAAENIILDLKDALGQ
jgi:hypothetical protein